jgi:hypothetical protein
MAPDRRVVRVSASFFDQLDEQLGAERSDAGAPSATDFVVIELPAIIERFATDFERLPEVLDGAPSGRMLIVSGLLVRGFAVYGLLMADSSIELIGVTLDP